MSRLAFACASALALSASACSGGEPSGDDERRLGEVSEALFANDHAAFDFFLGKGLTKVQAAGIIGNLDQESGVDPSAVQPGGPGRGIAQWSVGGRWNADANDNVVAYATAHAKSATSLALQLDFVWYELTSFSGYGLAELKKATTVSDAVQVFATKYEACGTCLETKRVTYAQQALAAYGDDVVDAGSGGTAHAKRDAGEDGASEPADEPPDGAAPSSDLASAREHGDFADTGGCAAAPASRSVTLSPILALAALAWLGRRRRRRWLA